MIGLVRTLRAKRTAKSWLRRLRLACVRRWFSFTPEEFVSTLRKVGVEPGDVLMVHSSFDRFDGFMGQPIDVIRALEDAVGADGTILMPTFPFTGLAVEYVARCEMFDVVATPSRMGLLTELFRRRRDVVRSVHPTHPVAAWGAKAEMMIAGHHLAATPCGAGTPFSRLLEHDGKILLLGTGILAMTFFHAVEEILEPKMPFTPFTKERFALSCRDKDGNVLISRNRLWDPDYARRRDPKPLVAALNERGAWRERRVGRLEVLLLRAREVVDALRVLADQGIYCYAA